MIMEDRPDKKHQAPSPCGANISDEDIYAAMKDISGYIDITPADFREIFLLSIRHASERMGNNTPASAIMTRDVLSVGIDTPIERVAALMAERGVSGVPVMDRAGMVAGVISEKDFITRMAGGARYGFMHIVSLCLADKKCLAAPVRGRTAADIMSAPAILASPSTPLVELARRMRERGVNRFPVVDGTGTLVGIVSRGDVLRAYCKGTADRR
jgi:CBS-domain-containing membrane protein